jgi:hypothetical protein
MYCNRGVHPEWLRRCSLNRSLVGQGELAKIYVTPHAFLKCLTPIRATAPSRYVYDMLKILSISKQFHGEVP